LCAAWPERGITGTLHNVDQAPQQVTTDDLDALLHQQDYVLSVREALRHVSRAAVRHRIKQGRWQQPYRGVVVAHSGPLSDTQRVWAGLLSVPQPALLGGRTAASLCGLRGYDQSAVHVLVPASSRVSDTRTRHSTDDSWPVIVHRTCTLTPEDALWRSRPPRTTAARSVVDAAQWARNTDDALAIIAAGIQQRITTPDHILRVLERLPRARRRNMILAAANDAAGGAGSLAEIDFVRLCRRYRLPPPDQQVRRTDVLGRKRYLDAYWRAWRLHVEIDGAHHLEARAWWDDMRRQNALWLAGDRVLRFPAWVVRHRPAEVAAQLREALRASGWCAAPHL
jgi:very-short-patch-repair endonuclease